MTDIDHLIAQAFSKASGASVVVVRYPDDEVIEVDADGKTYRMEIGSDDDEYVFLAADGSVVRFDPPEEL